MSERPEDKYRRLQSEVQRAILRSYPNPDRRGCPDESTINSLAMNPDRITAEDENDEKSAWNHITHCSPCYASFLEFRKASRGDS